MTLTLLAIINKVNVGGVWHVPAKENELCDGLSRGQSWTDLAAIHCPEFGGLKEAQYDKTRVIQACSPFQALDLTNDLWVEAISALDHPT